MKFSLIIPTKNRQVTAINAIKSGIQSNYKNLEIIVSDVSDEDSLRYKVKELNDHRIKYHYHSESLSMKSNWEFAVSKAKGDYVTVIGDDDALMPDGLLFAERIIKLSGTPVLYTGSPTYKWPDYSFLNRRNLIALNLPTTVIKISNPKEKLRRNYEFKGRCGTGPGIYHGLVQRKFLNNLKSKRGFYFKDENPDFDSGFCTLLYAESYLQTTYPIFISGHCGASNSGNLNYRGQYTKAVSKVIDEAKTQYEDFIWSDLRQISSLDVVIISAMRRFLPEANKILKGKKVELNKQNIFDMVAKGISHGYESSTFKYEVKVLKSLAKKWGVSPAAIPSKKQLNMGIITDKGINSSAIKKDERINKLFVDGDALGVKDIFDAMKIVNGLTVDWSVLLYHLGHTKNISLFDKPTLNSMDVVKEELQKENYHKATSLLEENISSNPMDYTSMLFLGVMYFNQKKFKEALPNLARSLSIRFDIQGFDAYFNSLIKLNQLDFARVVLENYSEEIAEENEQLTKHCLGLLEMASGNYSGAANIFNKIRPQIDSSLYFYCAAYAEFLKGKAANADNFLKKALGLNKTNEEFLELEAKIEACL